MTLMSARRRAVAALAAIGVAGVVLFLVPATAHAHVPIVQGVAECDRVTGNWKVTWTVKNSEQDIVGTITKVTVTPADAPVTTIVAGATLPFPAGKIVGVQIVPSAATQASLSVTASWKRPNYTVTDKATATVDLGGGCAAAKASPAATLASQCDGTVIATLSNAADATAPARLSVTGAEGFTKTAEVEPGRSAEVTVPAANAGLVKVSSGEKEIASGRFELPASCKPALPVTGSPLTGLVLAGTALVLLGAGALLYLRRHRQPGVRPS